jgi:hypothetical protein
MSVIVYHSTYGCDTGCCGHVIDLGNGTSRFSFSHPYDGDDPVQYAKDLITSKFGEEHVADLDWDHCFISDD